MNVRDYRLYHYEYRRPRWSNPTYNSRNIVDSLNMFVGNEISSHSGFYSGRYSLPNYQSQIRNYSNVVGPSNLQKIQFSNNQNPYLGNSKGISSNQKNPTYSKLTHENDHRRMDGDDYQKMGGSRLSQNAENRPGVKYKLGDSLTLGLQEYQSLKK